MLKSQFEKIEGVCKDNDSYLIYDDSDITNVKILDKEFDINENYVFVALNFSIPNKNLPKYFNFHCRYQGCSDWKIKKFFYDIYKNIFERSYMTDAIIIFQEPNSNVAYKEIIKDESKINENKIRLNNVLNNLSNAKLMCFGKKTYDLCLKKYKIDKDKLILLTHYSYRSKFDNLKKRWIDELKKSKII